MQRVPRLEPPGTGLEHTHAERVRFGDTDAAGIVYYANYLRWFEAGRAELLRAAGLPYRTLVDGGLTLPVVETWCRYHRPARYDDAIVVHSWVHELRAATLLVAHRIRMQDDETLLAEGAARLACVDETGRPLRLPSVLRKAVEGR